MGRDHACRVIIRDRATGRRGWAMDRDRGRRATERVRAPGLRVMARVRGRGVRRDMARGQGCRGEDMTGMAGVAEVMVEGMEAAIRAAPQAAQINETPRDDVGQAV
ncbi:hypothetical protein RO07_04525 [Pandoraea pulmonicola]|uniref:Uncharacterized protein n=1 Tax=Pandoraea pulmonicola TaxID=93221 RepID=A0ABM5RWT3_PANPU|nr:hypothetical protein RO07_04525 [Pandoraea pulmonicola]